MSETPFFFTREGATLFGMLHQPDGMSRPRAFVLSHPFAEEKLWSHRSFVSLARALAARGHAVLRFDYAGAGDSSGRSIDVTLDSQLADLAAALAALAARVPAATSVGLIGLRLGATIAALAAERPAHFPAALRPGPLVLWDPVLDGAEYLQELLRTNLSAQLAVYGKVIETREVLTERIRAGGEVDVDGYAIGAGLLATVGRADLLAATAKSHAAPALVGAIAPPNRPPKPRTDLQALAASYGAGSFTVVEEDPFWREIKRFYARAERLTAATLEFVERTDG